jgi:hypothetical protein
MIVDSGLPQSNKATVNDNTNIDLGNINKKMPTKKSG